MTAPVAPPLPSLQQLRDLCLKLSIPAPLEADIHQLLARAPGEAPQAYYDDALRLTQRCLTHLDSEVSLVTAARFGVADPNTLRQKLLGDPRRVVDNQLSALKQKLQSEKQEWTRRYTKQAADVQDRLLQELGTLETERHDEAGEHRVRLTPAWAQRHLRWQQDVFEAWCGHLVDVLPVKTKGAIEPELAGLRELLGPAATARFDPPPRLGAPPQTHDLAGLHEHVDLPTLGETVMETFKGGLSTVMMLAGTVGVMGSLNEKIKSSEVRAVVLTASLVPVLIFAGVQGRKHNRKLLQLHIAKSREKLRKDLDDAFKRRLERFKPEVERYVVTYLATSQQQLLARLESDVASVFSEREKTVSATLAQAQLKGDQIADQLNVLKQARQGLSGQLVVDIKRKMRELGGVETPAPKS